MSSPTRSWWSKVADRRDIVRQLRTLDEALLFVKMLGFAVAARALVRLRLPLLQALLKPRTLRLIHDPVRPEQISRLIDPVIRFGRPLVRPGCYTRGLTLYYFLRRAGLDVSLDFGMGKIGTEFSGHCWIVRDGKPFLETVDPRPLFTRMYSIPQPAPRSGIA